MAVQNDKQTKEGQKTWTDITVFECLPCM